MKNYKKIIYLLSLSLFIGVGIIAFIYKDNFSFITKKTAIGNQQSQGASSANSQNYVVMLNDELLKGETPKSKRELLEKYCNGIMNGNFAKGFKHGGFEYNPTKSVFVSHVCGYVVPELKDKIDPEYKNYIKDFDINSLKSTYPQFVGCENDMSSCNLILFLSKVYGGILNEFSNIKLATLYGYTDPEAKVEDLIKQFSNYYFGEKVCGGDENKFYLFNGKPEGPGDAHCSHPKTYQVLADFIGGIQFSIRNSKYVNAQELLKLEGECGTNTIKCAFSTSNSQWESFRNLYYNDLMYYNLFISYYIYNIASDPTYQEFSITSNVSSKFDDINSEIKLAENEIGVSQKATFQVDRMLRNVYATFAIHIGLMAYQEDITAFRDGLAKVYTPVNQLYYKLRNVQDVSSN